MNTNIFGLKKWANTNTNIFGLTKKANTITNTNIWTGICKYKNIIFVTHCITHYIVHITHYTLNFTHKTLNI